MKKVFFAAALCGLLFASCEKEELNTTSEELQYLEIEEQQSLTGGEGNDGIGGGDTINDRPPQQNGSPANTNRGSNRPGGRR